MKTSGFACFLLGIKFLKKIFVKFRKGKQTAQKERKTKHTSILYERF